MSDVDYNEALLLLGKSSRSMIISYNTNCTLIAKMAQVIEQGLVPDQVDALNMIAAFHHAIKPQMELINELLVKPVELAEQNPPPPKGTTIH